MLDIDDAITLFGTLFSITFWASMMIVIMTCMKIAIGITKDMKNWNKRRSD